MTLPRGTGSVSRSGNKWRASVRVDGRNRYLGTFDTEEKAERAVLEARGDGWKPTSETLAQWGQTWMYRRAHDGVHRCKDDEALIWRVRIAPTKLASMPLVEITPLHIREFVRGLLASRTKGGKPYARTTLVNALNCLRVCLRDAVDENLIDSNPAREVRIPRMPRTSEPWTWLTLDEIDRLLATYKPGYQRNVITFALYTGMRAGEIFGLRWEDVDFDNNVIIVKHSYDGPTKNGKVRRVPMLAPVREVLKLQREEFDRPRRVPVDRSLVFFGKATRLRKKGYNAGLSKHVKMAGIKRRVRFHDLRHSFASHLVQGSFGRVWTLYEVSAVLGHTGGIAITTRYAHLSEGGIQRAARETNAFPVGVPTE